ncbi:MULTISPECIES: hypothetical protein [unclassified Bradyrhizobium]|uniref:hypothetical protein n=1 Tax=unclassified Bradyrhizobium TaxID=2631580 RepID=UPI0028E7199D|nr:MULTISPECIES: hypothetical protein [unclassified Bradyrhizobium]
MISTCIKDANRLLAMPLPDIDRIMPMIAKQVRQALALPTKRSRPSRSAQEWLPSAAAAARSANKRKLTIT